MALQDEMGGERQKDPRTGSVPELKEKKQVVQEVSQGHVDTGTRMGREKDVVGKRRHIYTALYSFLPTLSNAISTPKCKKREYASSCHSDRRGNISSLFCLYHHSLSDLAKSPLSTIDNNFS